MMPTERLSLPMSRLTERRGAQESREAPGDTRVVRAGRGVVGVQHLEREADEAGRCRLGITLQRGDIGDGFVLEITLASG